MEITLSEDVSSIYQKCGLDVETKLKPRTTINTGTLYKRLNTKFNSVGSTQIGYCLANNSLISMFPKNKND